MKKLSLLFLLWAVLYAVPTAKASTNTPSNNSILPIPTFPTDSTATPKKPAKKKIDKRGEFRFSTQYKTKDPYLGSYDNTGNKYLNAQYLGFEARYKTFFGLYFAVAPEFLFNKDSIQFVGNYLTLGFEREWFEGFTTDLYYSYNIKQQDGGRRLRNLYSNTASFHVQYENDYITPEVGYTFMFGKVTGGTLDTFAVLGYDPVKAMGKDHLLMTGISHTFTVFDSTKQGDLDIKIGNKYNFGTANQLLTGRNFIKNPKFQPGERKVKKVVPLENPITNDKFSALNTEFALTIDYTWRWIELIPELNFSVPFRDLRQAQIDANTHTVTDHLPGPNQGMTYVVAGNSNLASKPIVWGGITLVLNWPFRKVK